MLLGRDVYGQPNQTLVIVAPDLEQPRIGFGLEKLTAALKDAGYRVVIQKTPDDKPVGGQLLVGIALPEDSLQNEGYRIRIADGMGNGQLTGADASGVLYGCLELTERIAEQKAIPAGLDITDHPEMVLRGTAIGVQKPYYLPGRTVYEYPYTPEVFPWLYDKALWIRYLDMLVENRYNSLYLWNGHPFASLVKLPDYPYAVEVDEETFRKNEELFAFLTAEADKRGIWVIQMFYNIIVSKPFAEHHGIKTQDRNRPIVPMIADYTRKSIAAFVAKYPNVGLLVTLGEAMEGAGQDDVDWFTQTIIPGVQDGLKALGREDEPPIVLRAHDTDAPRVMEASKPLYGNLYTMAKYNGEALTTYTPRGKWAELHRSLSAAAPVHIQNVHILANLEPFRYGSPDFIQRSVRAMHEVYGSNGLHLYPQASYWDWPYTADRISSDSTERLLQLERDWIWYRVWARYAWQSNRDRREEQAYWAAQLADYYGTSKDGGRLIVEAYEETGEIAPKLLRRFGITDGNRQTLTLGMFMTQLINPYRYSLFTLLYESEAPEGEMIIDEARKRWHGESPVGETPSRVAEEVVRHAATAVSAIDRAAPLVGAHNDEFKRLQNDVHCYEALAGFYATKVRAALLVLRYKYSYDVADLEAAAPLLAQSLVHFKTLVDLTESSYYYANSMQTPQRRIPIRGVDGRYKTWAEMLPLYRAEYEHFIRSIDSLKAVPDDAGIDGVTPLANAPVELKTPLQRFEVAKGQRVFGGDDSATIADVAADLLGLEGIRLDKAEQLQRGTQIDFTTDKPVNVLVGYFVEDKLPFGTDRSERPYAPKPTLEIDASAADFGQAEVKISNAIEIAGHPRVDVHSYTYGPGSHTLHLPKGLCLVLGIIPANAPLREYNAGIGVADADRDIDWLFETNNQ